MQLLAAPRAPRLGRCGVSLPVLSGLAALSCWHSAAALAHDGPPFPLIASQRLGPDDVSVWIDPDVGQARIFVLVTTLPATLAEPDHVRVAVQPVSARLPERVYVTAQNGESAGGSYFSAVTFDRAEPWHVRVFIDRSGVTRSAEARVDATDDAAPGPSGLALYGLPFLAAGGLWLRVVFARAARRNSRVEPSSDERSIDAST
jgi:hypothetical protein